MDRPPVARLTEVSHRYGAVAALDGVTLVLPGGCMVGLIGPDGVGKSSLLALLSGARRIQDGRVEVLGGDIGERRFRAAVQPRIAYMPQGLGKNLYPTLSVFENVDFFGRLFGQGRAERELRIADAQVAFAEAAAVQGALRGMGGVAAGLVLGSGLKMIPALRSNVLGWSCCLAIGGCGFLAVVVLKWSLSAVVAILGPVGVGLAWRRLAP